MTTNETPKAKPRLTVKQLHDYVEKRFDELDKARQKGDELVATLDHDLALNEQKTKEISYLIGEPLERKLRGITRANAEVEALKKRVGLLEPKLGDDVDPLIRERAGTELERIETRLETLFGELSSDYDTLKATVDEHTGLLAEHTGLLDDHDKRISAAAMEAGMATEGVHSLSNRVTVFEEEVKFPLGRFIISVILGLIAGFIWNAHPFAQTKKLADGSAFVITSPADEWWAAVLFGLVVFAAIFWVLTLFRRKAKTEVTSETTTTTKQKKQRKPLFGYRVVRDSNAPTAPQSETPPKETTDADATPTKVLETSTGAASTRS